MEDKEQVISSVEQNLIEELESRIEHMICPVVGGVMQECKPTPPGFWSA